MKIQTRPLAIRSYCVKETKPLKTKDEFDKHGSYRLIMRHDEGEEYPHNSEKKCFDVFEKKCFDVKNF